MRCVYLDNSSTTKQAEEVTEEIRRTAEEQFGNPSSLHQLGVEAEKKVSEARKRFADAVGARPDEIFFNSGGTEGDNTVLFGLASAYRREKKNIVTTKVEHPAVLEACRTLRDFGFEIREVPVDRSCRVSLSDIEDRIDDQTILVSMMAVNNEIGTIFPVREAAQLAHRSHTLFHTDAVQAFGKMDLRGTGADLLTVSSHKVHGPKGVGAMMVKKGTKIRPLIVGGGQERHFRSGTENVPGISGFGEAVRLLSENSNASEAGMKTVRQHLLDEIRRNVPDIVVNSPDVSEGDLAGSGICSVLNISFLGTRGEVLLHTLEQDGIYVSTGSACSSNKKGKSHVLTAMGLSDEEIDGTLRFSFSRYNTIEEMDYAAEKIEQAVKKFRKLRSFMR